MSRDYDDHDVSPRAIITHTSSGSPGRTTRTARLSPSMRSIARALVAEPSTPTTQVQAKGELALDGPEVHALAAHGTAGSGSSLPFLDQIQRAFGRHDVSGVKAHIGGPAAEAAQAMGARAYASGDRVAFAREPDLFLVAHEAAHVVQQRAGVQLSGGVGRSGDSYERHADEVATAVVEGRSAAELLDRYAGADGSRGGAGTAAVQRDDEEDEERLPHRMRRAMREERHRAGREHEQDVYLGTDIGVIDAEGAPVRRHVGGGDSEGRTSLGRGSSLRGGTQRTRVVRDGETEIHEEIDEETRSLTQTTRREGRQAHELDAAAMAADLRAQLAEERRDVQQRARQAGDPASRAELEREAEELGRDIERLAQVQPGDDPGTVRDIARRRRMLVAPQYRVRSGDLTTRERGLDPNARAGTVRHRDRVTTASTHGEETRTSVRETRREVNVGDGTVEIGRREEDDTRVGDAHGRLVRDRSTRVTVDDGVRVRHRREASDMLTDPDGTEQERSRVREGRGGIVADENGWGVTGGGTRRDAHRVGDDEVATELSADLTLRENSVGGRTTSSTTLERGDTTFGTKVSADGSFTIDIRRENDATPPRYRLVFTIHVGGSVGVSVDHEARRRGVRGGAHARGRASGDLVLRRTLTAQQARRYWTEAERAERDGDAAARSSLPEFQRLARIRAGWDNRGQVANAHAITGDASAARAMAEGEETELTLRAGVNVDGNLGHRGEGHDVGVEAERDDEWTRRVRVQRIGSGETSRVRVTVTYEHAGRWHVEAEGSAGGGPTVGVRRGGGSGDGDTYRFTLDPNSPTFDEHYAAIVRTTSRDELRALAENPAYQQEVDYRERSESDSTEGSEEISQGDLSIAMQRRGRYEERVRQREDALSGEVRGSQDTSLQIGGPDDMVLARGGNEGSAHAVVERDGQMDVTLEHREHNTDPARAAREDREARARASTEERVRDAVRETPRERLRRILSTEYSTLRGYYLDEGDIETVVQRAADRPRWEACASSPRMFQAWQRLRQQLRSPDIQADEAEIDRDIARKLAIARHLARFYQAHGEYAHTAMANVLRNWGAAGISGVTRDSRAADVGAEYEWPHALRSRKTTFESIRAEVRDLERAAAGQATEGDASEDSQAQRYDRAASLHDQLTQIYLAVQQSRDFDSEGARVSLLREIDDYRTRLRRLRVSHREQSRTARELAREGRAPDQLDHMMQEARADAEIARARIRTILQRLREYKRREQAELRRANELSYNHSGIPEAVRICGQLHDMALVWYRDVQELRRAYETAGVPRSEWEVSDRGGTRSRTLEPEVGWLIEIYLRCHARNPVDNGRARAAQWRQEFRSY